jgi:hypothetical protein
VTLQHPDAFASGVIDGHRLRENKAPIPVLLGMLDHIDWILDEKESQEVRERAGEFVIGFAEGWAHDGS